MRRYRQALIWTIGIIAVTALYLALVIRPQIRKLHALIHDIEASRFEQTRDDQEEQILAVLHEEVSKATARTARFSVQVPRNEMLGTFLEDLARLTEEHQLGSDHIEPGKPVRADQVMVLPITLGVRGSFPGLFALVQDIERMERLTQLEELKMATDPESPGMATAELRLRIFFQAM